MRGKGAKISKKLILDDVCGVQENSFKNKRIFQNHYRTHGEEKFQCSECPAIWSEGPENIFNTNRYVGFPYPSTFKVCTSKSLAQMSVAHCFETPGYIVPSNSKYHQTQHVKCIKSNPTYTCIMQT